MAYAALLSALQVLEAQITNQVHFHNLSTIKQQIKTLHESFCFLQAFLEDDHSRATDCLESRIREAAYCAEDIVEFYVLNRTKESCPVSRTARRASWRNLFANHRREKNTDPAVVAKLYEDVQSLVDQVCSIVEEVTMIMETREVEFSDQIVDSGCVRIERISMVGFDDDLMEMKEQLCDGSSKLQIVPIVGMGGIGKTALATNVFHDSLITYHFHVRAWTTITQDHKVPDILLGLLRSMASESVSEGTEMHAECLYKCLKGRKYLVVLDDIWSKEAWDEVRMFFPDDSNGSRIILTTRLVDVAVYANSSRPFHRMQFLDEVQSWNLLKEKVFGQECSPPELEEIGKLIARNCRGLPLSIILVAGLLSKTSMQKHQWEDIARDVGLAETSSKILSLSYSHLPRHLRPCFLYIGGYPEDYEIPVSELITLWVAEGFLKPIVGPKPKCLEEVGEEYLEDLVKRSLVLVTRKRSNGKFRFCSIHDLLRDLCIRKSQDEKFLHRMEGIQDSTENKRRLSFSKSVEWFHFKNANNATRSPVRSIFCCSYNFVVLTGFSLLKILHILEVNMESFPVEILGLSHLKFVSFTTGCIRYCTLPPSLPKLQKLQALIVGSSVKFSTKEHRLTASLPIWNMPQLRHLVFLNITLSSSIRDKEFSVLENLQTLSRVRNFRFTKQAIEMVPNLKKLKAIFTGSPHNYELDNLVHITQLETLSLEFRPYFSGGPIPVSFSVPLKVKKLTLQGCGLWWKDMTVIGSLPNLEVLKLLHQSVMGEEWEPVEEEFPRLRFLQMERLDLKHWIVENNTLFPSLECLIIRQCFALESIPCGVGEIASLRVIHVDDGKSDVTQSAKEILEEQRSMGNDVLQVRVGSHWIK